MGEAETCREGSQYAHASQGLGIWIIGRPDARNGVPTEIKETDVVGKQRARQEGEYDYVEG